MNGCECGYVSNDLTVSDFICMLVFICKFSRVMLTYLLFDYPFLNFRKTPFFGQIFVDTHKFQFYLLTFGPALFEKDIGHRYPKEGHGSHGMSVCYDLFPMQPKL